MKKKTIRMSALLSLMMMVMATDAKAQDLGICTYDAAGNRLERFTYIDDTYNRSSDKMVNQFDLANIRLGSHTIYVDYSSESLITIEVLGLNDDDICYATIYNLVGIRMSNQRIVNTRTEISLSDYSNGVYLLRVNLNSENRCWKIIKK